MDELGRLYTRSIQALEYFSDDLKIQLGNKIIDLSTFLSKAFMSPLQDKYTAIGVEEDLKRSRDQLFVNEYTNYYKEFGMDKAIQNSYNNDLDLLEPNTTILVSYRLRNPEIKARLKGGYRMRTGPFTTESFVNGEKNYFTVSYNDLDCTKFFSWFSSTQNDDSLLFYSLYLVFMLEFSDSIQTIPEYNNIDKYYKDNGPITFNKGQLNITNDQKTHKGGLLKLISLFEHSKENKIDTISALDEKIEEAINLGIEDDITPIWNIIFYLEKDRKDLSYVTRYLALLTGQILESNYNRLKSLNMKDPQDAEEYNRRLIHLTILAISIGNLILYNNKRYPIPVYTGDIAEYKDAVIKYKDSFSQRASTEIPKEELDASAVIRYKYIENLNLNIIIPSNLTSEQKMNALNASGFSSIRFENMSTDYIVTDFTSKEAVCALFGLVWDDFVIIMENKTADQVKILANERMAAEKERQVTKRELENEFRRYLREKKARNALYNTTPDPTQAEIDDELNNNAANYSDNKINLSNTTHTLTLLLNDMDAEVVTWLIHNNKSIDDHRRVLLATIGPSPIIEPKIQRVTMTIQNVNRFIESNTNTPDKTDMLILQSIDLGKYYTGANDEIVLENTLKQMLPTKIRECLKNETKKSVRDLTNILFMIQRDSIFDGVRDEIHRFLIPGIEDREVLLMNIKCLIDMGIYAVANNKEYLKDVIIPQNLLSEVSVLRNNMKTNQKVNIVKDLLAADAVAINKQAGNNEVANLYDDVDFTYNKYISTLVTQYFQLTSTPQPVMTDGYSDQYEMFWNGISYEQYKAIPDNIKYILDKTCLVFGLYDLNKVTRCDMLINALNRGYTVTRVCFLSIPFNNDNTLYTMTKNISTKIPQIPIASMPLSNNIGLNEQGFNSFSAYVLHNSEASILNILTRYVQESSINPGTFDVNLENNKVFITTIINKLKERERMPIPTLRNLLLNNPNPLFKSSYSLLNFIINVYTKIKNRPRGGYLLDNIESSIPDNINRYTTTELINMDLFGNALEKSKNEFIEECVRAGGYTPEMIANTIPYHIVLSRMKDDNMRGGDCCVPMDCSDVIKMISDSNRYVDIKQAKTMIEQIFNTFVGCSDSDIARKSCEMLRSIKSLGNIKNEESSAIYNNIVSLLDELVRTYFNNKYYYIKNIVELSALCKLLDFVIKVGCDTSDQRTVIENIKTFIQRKSDATDKTISDNITKTAQQLISSVDKTYEFKLQPHVSLINNI